MSVKKTPIGKDHKPLKKAREEVIDADFLGTGGTSSTTAKFLREDSTFTNAIDALSTDTISEKTADTGVTIDGVVVKDNTLSTLKKKVISGDSIDTAGAATLTAAQSGCIILFDKVNGLVLTLPADAVGLEYEFWVTASVTSGAYAINGAAAGDLMIGSLLNVDTDTSNAVAAWRPNGSTHYKISMNGAETGGLIGTRIIVKCLAADRWGTEGVIHGSGVVATPYAA